MPDRSPRLVIRADASDRLGGGHVRRCLSLAEIFQAKGWRCALAGRAGTEQTVPLPDGLEWFLLAGAEEDEPALLRQHWPDGVDLLIVDHYERSAPWERQTRPWARFLMIIDDLANRPHEGDLLLDQAAGRSPNSYQHLIPPGCRLLLGPRYALLRGDFERLREVALRRRAEPGQRILLNFGAVDPNNRAGDVLAALAATGHPLNIDIVCGASTENVPVLRDLAAKLCGSVSVVGQVDNMAEVMARADLAIGAGGSASWERCALGLPALILTLAENQALTARTLAEAGAALSFSSDTPLGEIAGHALSLLNSPTMLTAMAAQAAALCDGAGARRVAEIVENSTFAPMPPLP